MEIAYFFIEKVCFIWNFWAGDIVSLDVPSVMLDVLTLGQYHGC